MITNVKENLFKAFRNIFSFRKPTGIRSFIMFGHLQKRAVLKADLVGILMGPKINRYVKKLGLLHKMKKLRLAWDVEKYHIPEDVAYAEKYKKYDVVYFMIARHSWKLLWNDMKGNDKFIRAYARFVLEKKPSSKLICIEKGPDVNASKDLIKSLGIRDYVEWVKEMNKDGIRSCCSLSNVVVVDQFKHDKWEIRYPEDKGNPRFGFGSGALEAMSAARPLITHFFIEDFYDGNQPPIFTAFTEEQIYNCLIESLEMGDQGRKELGEKAYAFVKKYHGWENTIELYIDLLKDILKKNQKNV